jgi:GTP-binding protein EngB required for normal cell division
MVTLPHTVLPFAGYAKVSQEKRGDWHSMTQQYFKHRATLVDILLLVDASLPPKDAVRQTAAAAA